MFVLISGWRGAYTYYESHMHARALNTLVAWYPATTGTQVIKTTFSDAN